MQSIFGTDGIRGVFNQDINCKLAMRLGYALGQTLTRDKPIVIGRDTRISGPALLDSIAKGMNLFNREIIDIGVCPTPAIPYLIKKLECSCGIMISASHNPPEYNGIKIFDHEGKKLHKNAEILLENLIDKTNKISIPNNPAKINKKYDLLSLYENSLIDSLTHENLEGMKIILDNCNGSATSCADRIFKKLGANIEVINNEANGSKINVNCGSTCLEPLKKAVAEYNADMGFSFDGDADRVIGIDSQGNLLDGDHILFLWGRELMEEKKLKNNLLITTVMSNLGFENAWKNIGGNFYRTAVGDKFIYEAIINKGANLGGEQSGHILSNKNDYCGDGILTAIQISKYCKKKKISLNTWLKSSFKAMPQKLSNINLPSKIINFESSLKNEINQTIEKTLEKISAPCRIYVRPSGTEPILRILVEGDNDKIVRNCSEKVKKEIEIIIQSSSDWK